MNHLQKFVIQNAKFSKFLLKKHEVSFLILTKCFQKILGQSPLIIMIIWMLGTLLFFLSPFDHSWFFHQGDEIKNQNDFPNWFQEWWLFFGSIKDIFCPQILEEYQYFDDHGDHLVPTHCSKVLFFLSRFQNPWILCWDFVLSQMISTHFPHAFGK